MKPEFKKTKTKKTASLSLVAHSISVSLQILLKSYFTPAEWSKFKQSHFVESLEKKKKKASVSITNTPFINMYDSNITL